MFGWLKKKIVANEANKSGLLKKFMEWIVQPGNRRIVVGVLLGLSAALTHMGYVVPAGWVDQAKGFVDSITPGMDAGAFIILIWSILVAKKKAREDGQ